MRDRGTRSWINKNHQSLQHRRTSNWLRFFAVLRPCRAPHKAGAFSPSALAMQHNCIRRYQFVMTPLSMYDTLSSNSTSAAEGGRRVTKVWWHASRTVHREHHSGACPLAPPHKHTRCHTRGHQRNAQHEANGTTRQPNDALPDATHAPLMMIRRHWTNKSYKKQSCLW